MKEAGRRDSVEGEEGAGQHGSRVIGVPEPPRTERFSRSSTPPFSPPKARLAERPSETDSVESDVNRRFPPWLFPNGLSALRSPIATWASRRVWRTLCSGYRKGRQCREWNLTTLSVLRIGDLLRLT